MFDVHLTTIKAIDIDNNVILINSTFGEKEISLSQIKSGTPFELPKYQKENDKCYVFVDTYRKKTIYSC